jgi:hypothetical protein
MAMLDLRRTDVRKNTLENPYWETSGIITPEADDQEAVLFSFPAEELYGYFLVTEIAIEAIEAFVGGTLSLSVGVGTIANDDLTTGDTLTAIDSDFYFAAESAGIVNPGLSFPVASQFVTDKAAANSSALLLPCVDTDVYCIYASLTSDAIITAGQCRIQVLGSYVPVQ